MDIQQRISQFLSQYQTTGWLITLMLGGLLVQGLLYIILALLGQVELYTRIIDGLVLPPHFSEWVYQPWSILSYPFFIVDFQFGDIFDLLFNGLVLWTFGRIHQQLLGEQRTRRLVILGIPLIGILTLTISTIAGYHLPETSPNLSKSKVEQTQTPPSDASALADSTAKKGTNTSLGDTTNKGANASPGDANTQTLSGIRAVKKLRYTYGLIAIVMILVISCITLVPDYPIPLFLFGRVKIVWVGLVLFLLSWMVNGSFILPPGIAIFLGGLLGFLHVYLLRNGTDLTEVIWSFYSDDDHRPRMKVKYGSKGNQTSSGRSSRTPSKTDENGNSIPQEIIDGILDKISDKGYDSLSREEKELLFKASTQKEDDVD